MINVKLINSLSTKLLAEEAIQRGIFVRHLNSFQEEETFLELKLKKHIEYIIGQAVSKTTLEAYLFLQNKELTKVCLRKNKINVAKGRVFKKNDLVESRLYCKNIGYPVVLKPIFGAHGDLVFVGIKNIKKLQSALNEIFKKEKYVLIEKEFRGKEYRFTADREKVFGVIYRDAANVVGDGIHAINELIKLKNNDHRRGDGYEKVMCKIIINKIVRQNLAEQGLKLNSIIPKEKKIYLRKNSNLSTGGDSIDLTDVVHPEFNKIAIKAINSIPGLAYGGVDLMSNVDISKKPKKNNYIILEINSSPGISMHYDPIKGKTRDVAKEIIDILFPETKGRYINI